MRHSKDISGIKLYLTPTFTEVNFFYKPFEGSMNKIQSWQKKAKPSRIPDKTKQRSIVNVNQLSNDLVVYEKEYRSAKNI